VSSHRIGLIVPSSNVTVETELPLILQGNSADRRFSFHSSRARMRQVSEAELAAMNLDAERCAVEVSDAGVDAIVYGCLIALISQGPEFPDVAAGRIARAAAENGSDVPVITSAGALVDAIRALGAEKVALVTPYMPPLTQKVVEFLELAGIAVGDAVSMSVPDNTEVGRLDPGRLPAIAEGLDLDGVDAVVLSACVQMPSLPAIEVVEEALGLPVLSAATATARSVLLALDLPLDIAGAGRLLAADAAHA
jgi:maleate isomerase